MLETDLVVLDQDHPGFRDRAYRARRDAIAQTAIGYHPGQPVPDVEYAEEEQAVWRTVWEHLDPLHARYACRPYREAAAVLSLDRRRIPQLSELNRALAGATGFSMQPVAGLVTPKLFMDRLDDGVFLATQYIRHHSRPLYTPEPDVVHEIVGHAPSLIQAGFVRLSRAFGAASKIASVTRTLSLIRLYWYTLEFGVVEEQGALKVYGAGLLSSYGELERFEQAARLQPLDIERVIETPFDPTNYQQTLFVAPSFERMIEDVASWVAG